MACRFHFDATSERWREQRERLAGWCDHPNQTASFNGTKMCRPCFDGYRLWRDSEEQRAREEQDACPNCQREHRIRFLRSQLTESIDPTQPWGQHIALTCVNHPDLRWNTKNIECIGARSIFFNGFWQGIEECACPIRDLRVVPPSDPEYTVEGIQAELAELEGQR